MQLDTEIAGTETEVIDTPETDAAEIETEGHDSEDTENKNDAADDGEVVDGDVDTELKTVRKALDKRNRYINNQRQRIRALEAEMQKLRDIGTQNKTEAPAMDKFDSVLDYMKADQTYTLEQKLAEQANKQQMSALEHQQQLLMAQQAQEMAGQMQEMISSNPDVQKVISSNANVIQSMPPHIEKLMAEIDNAPAATYALAKEGRLQDLYYMPPHIAAAHLVQAEIRGQQYLQQSAPKQTQLKPAHKPIGSLKGTGKGTKSYEDMNPDELAKRFLK